LAKCQLPALQHLDLAIATEAAPDDGWLEATVEIVKKLPPLQTLTLEGPYDASEVITALAPLKSRLPQTLRLVGSPRDEDELAAAVALVRGGRLTTLQLPLEDFVDDTVAALRKAVATVEDCDTQFLPSAYNLDAFLLKPVA
jgi:hypothetical protein